VGALNILEAAGKHARDAQILFIGSSEEYSQKDGAINENDPLCGNNPYGISKMTQEQFVECYRARYGLKIHYVRPFNHTGIGQRDSFVLPSFCKQAADLEASGIPGEIRVGNLTAKRDFSDVRDIVRAYRMILESPDDRVIYNVGSGKAYGLDEMLDYIVSLCKTEVKVVVDQERFRPIDTPIVLCDNSLIREKLGWEPEYSIFDTLKGMFEYYLKNE
jgi:GDP-4-dehydro-6-deoxy-D-mannose reductase